MRCVLGIDSGGTKCDAILVADDGTAVGWGRCDVASPESGRGWGGSGRSMPSIRHAVSQAMEGVELDELHVVGAIEWVPAGFLREGHPVKIQVHGLPGEAAAALALVGETVGVVVLAGTGAFVYGKTREGREALLDALGPMLGDYGGGYQIGSLAVRAAAKSGWNPRHQTSLAPVIHKACGINEAEPRGRSLIGFMYEPHDRAEIAAFAKLVDFEAEAGDRIARAILEKAAADIAETLRDVVDRLGIANDEYAMIGTGGVATGSRTYWQHFCALAKEFAPGLKPVISDLPAVLGTVLPTLRALAATDPQAMESRLFQSTRQLLSRNTG